MQNTPNLFAIHYHANKEKAVSTLLGILVGISADRTINPVEASFLRMWIKENIALRSDPDCIDLLDCLADVLAKPESSHDLLSDALQLIDDIIHFRSPQAASQKYDEANKLLGIITGLTADCHLSNVEIFALQKWVTDLNSEEWPIPQIKKRIDEILKDGVITDDERFDLLTLLRQSGSSAFTETGSSDSLTVTFGCVEVESIIFPGSTFCFTGTFAHGNRNACEQTILTKGGLISGINRKLNYLVLGTFPSKDWITSSYGTKIQKAIDIQSGGHPLVLITEQTWSRFL